MSDDELKGFERARLSLEAVKVTEAGFRRDIASAESSVDEEKAFPGATFVDAGDGLVVTIFDVAMRASPRFIFEEDRFVAAEYLLMAPMAPGGDEVEICRLYLQAVSPPVLWPQFDFGDRSKRVCDANNSYVRKDLLKYIGMALLQSELFRPKP